MTPKNKQNEFLIKVSLYLLYLLPFFLGLGAFIPNIFYLILFSIFIYFIFNKQIKFSEFNNIFIKLLLLFWSISVLSSFFSDNKIISLISSISFIRFITFAILTYWLIKNKFINYNLFFKTIIITLSIVLFFAYFEFFTGYNIILDDLSNIIKEGLKQPQTRITSLFGDEQVLGGYLLRILLFSLIIYFALDSKIKNNYKYYFLFLILSCFMFIILSGERSSIFMLIFSILSIIFFIDGYKKIKATFVIFFLGILVLLILLRPDLYNRLITQTFKLQIYSAEKKTVHIFSSVHEAHLKTAINIFIDKPILGGGNKSFRYLCHEEKYSYNIQKFAEGDKKGLSTGCANHPHNYYFQVLSENGIFNFLLIIFFYLIVIKFICKHIYLKYVKKIFFLNNMQVSIYLFYLITLWPVVPSGSLFSSWIASTIFLPMGFLIYNLRSKNES